MVRLVFFHPCLRVWGCIWGSGVCPRGLSSSPKPRLCEFLGHIDLLTWHQLGNMEGRPGSWMTSGPSNRLPQR
ncbi:uncharacterized protein BDZ83DRAFT_201338 [Colletotrichum acutatum]|uniref:Secreted protein n=1 Tax=Glomerella acutata TaxID=27357 RepID=A0AAD8U5J9_GLOAC|nr:uncharacterized protein BDZ83DRAFT_201338 [Colletotrichum acutatum]KAK1705938.1 hypothetical protein BDZ83DRAFT_201338 [Colletotrichum acutatum]